MIFTGVDWSGDVGANSEGPSKPGLLAVAFASIHNDQRDRLHHSLADVRDRHHHRPGYIFKHADSTHRLRTDFFDALATSGVEVRVRLIDKARDWPAEFWQIKRGDERLASSLAEATSLLPAALIEDQTLLLDLHKRKDGRLCTLITKAVHRSTRTEGRRGFSKIRPCPDDDDSFGEIIQVADMVAGAVRRAGSEDPPDYPQLARVLVPWA